MIARMYNQSYKKKLRLIINIHEVHSYCQAIKKHKRGDFKRYINLWTHVTLAFDIAPQYSFT